MQRILEALFQVRKVYVAKALLWQDVGVSRVPESGV